MTRTPTSLLRAPAPAQVATRTAPARAGAEDGMTLRADALWQTELFTLTVPIVRDRGRVSAREAYQGALYGRGIVIDVRGDDERRADGIIACSVRPLELRRGADLSGLAGAARLYVITGGSDVDPAEFAALDPERPEILVVDGGFGAWAADGLPVERA